MSPLVLGDKAHVHPPGLVERSLHGTTSQNDAMTECLESHLLLTGVPTFWHGVASYPNFGGLKVIHLLSSLGQTWGARGLGLCSGFHGAEIKMSDCTHRQLSRLHLLSFQLLKEFSSSGRPSLGTRGLAVFSSYRPPSTFKANIGEPPYQIFSCFKSSW